MNTLRWQEAGSNFLFFFKDFIYLLLERGEGKEKERERNSSVWLPLARPPLGNWPTTQACALTGNRTSDPLVRRLVLNPLSHTSQGQFCMFFKKYFTYLFLERGEGKEKERERNVNVWLPLTWPPLGTWPATQACALTGNRTSGPLVHRLVLNPLSHTSQGCNMVFI